MNTLKRYFKTTLIVSILVAIIFPLFVSWRSIDWDWFIYLMALGFVLVWAIYAIVMFVSVFFSKDALKARNLIGKDPKGIHFLIIKFRSYGKQWLN